MTYEEVKEKVREFIDDLAPEVDKISVDFVKGSHWFEVKKGK